MIFHPNPMFQERGGYWHDTKLRTIRVEPRLLDRKNFRQRWIVLQKKSFGNEVVSQHISESMAVVAAQRLANRLWVQAQKKQKEHKAAPVHLEPKEDHAAPIHHHRRARAPRLGETRRIERDDRRASRRRGGRS